MSGYFEMPKHGWFTVQTGGSFVVQIGGLFDANTHHVSIKLQNYRQICRFSQSLFMQRRIELMPLREQ